MSTGYTRQDTSNNISNGNVIDADDLDLEFNAVESAFNSSAGHTHDGSAGQGAAITKVGPAQDLVVSTVSVLPKTSNTLDLGSPASQFKDLHIDGVANIDSLVADTADINGGTVDGTVIGATVAAAGTFSTATVTGNLTVDTHTLFVDSVNNRVGVGVSAPASKLEVAGDIKSIVAGTSSIMALSGDATNFTYLRLRQTPTESRIENYVGGTGALTPVTVHTGGSERLRVTPTGDVGIGTSTPAYKLDVSGTVNATALAIGGTTITPTAAELNFVDGVTSAIQTQLNAKQPLDADLTALAALAVTDGNFIVGNGTTWVVESGLTARTSLGLGTIATQDASTVAITGGTISGITDLAIADGGTGASTAAGALLNFGITSTAAELNILDGVVASAAEINFVDGVTSNIQTQLNAKQPLDADLTAIAALSPLDGNFIVGNGSTWVVENDVTARTSLGLGTIATQSAASVNITGGTIAGITDLAIADGGTGASTAAAALVNLGLTATAAELNLVTSKQPLDATLTALSGLATGANKIPMASGTDTFTQVDFKDEDDMVSNSATAIPSQQSVKAYVDATTGPWNIASTVLNGASASSSITTMDFADGYEYRLEFRDVTTSVTAGQWVLVVTFENGDISPAMNITGTAVAATGDDLWGYANFPLARLPSYLHVLELGGEEDANLATTSCTAYNISTKDFKYVVSTTSATKIKNVAILNTAGGTFTGGVIYLHRRKIHNV